MKKLISILMVMIMVLSLNAYAEKTEITGVIGGADGPTAIFVTSDKGSGSSIVIPFDANITTGYSWTAFVVGGNSVVIDEAGSGYESNPNPDNLDGVGGTHYFKLDAAAPGKSIIRFAYARGWEEFPIEETYILADVDEDMNIHIMDVTESGVYDGVVEEVNAEDCSVLLYTDRAGEVIARFDEDEALPVQEEHIVIYTDGTMTMSLPGIVNVIAWSSVPSDEARETETDLDDEGAIEEMLAVEAAKLLTELAGDTEYTALFTQDEEILSIISGYAQIDAENPVDSFVSESVSGLAAMLKNELGELTPVGEHILEQRMYNSGTVANMLAAIDGPRSLAAVSVVNISEICDLDIPSMLYVLEYENDTGIIVGIWNNGEGLNQVTASFAPHISVLKQNADLTTIYG